MNPAYLKIGGDLLSNALLDTVTVTQELNRHWLLEVEFRQTKDERPHYENYLGKACSLFAYDQDGAEVTVFEGFVLKSKLEYKVHGNYGGRLVAVSQSYKADLTPRYFCYTTNALSAIAAQACGFSGLDSSVQASAQTAPKQYVQWGETDYRFLLRLADDHGAWIRPTASGVEILDSFQAGTTASFRAEMGLLSFRAGGGLGPAAMNGAHYDPLVMQSQSFTGVAQQPSFTGASGPLANAVLQGSQSVLPAGYVFERSRVPGLADYEQRLKHESERALGSRVLAQGVSRVLRLRAGDKVQIDGALDANGTYGLTKVVHRWTLHGYENEFWCTPWVKWLEPVAPQRPVVDGVFPARIIEHSDPLGLGRYRIRFWWQELGEPMLWARMMTPHAGQSRGFFFQPEIGDEVVVMFEDGDPERPLILGSVWNGVDTAPTEDFWGGEYGPNDVKRIVTKSGNRVQMVDKPGKEALSFATPENLKLSMFEQANETGRSMIQLSNANGDILLSAPNGRIHLHGKYISREAGDSGAGASAPAAPAVHLMPVSAPAVPKAPTAPIAPAANSPAPQKRNPCAVAREKDQELAAQAVARAKAIWQKSGMPGDLPQNGPTWFPAEQSPCLNKAAEMQGRAARFQKYSKALPYARATQDVNELGDKPGSQAKGRPCITRLPDTGEALSKALGLRPDAIKDTQLKQDDNGFRAAMYRDESTGKLILVPRDTEPHSLADWKTNTDNGMGLDTDQYYAMRNLAKILKRSHVAFDLAGYSKGAGLAQEGGLVAPDSDVYVFNGAGLSDASLARTGNANFDTLANHVHALNAPGDFLTMMNNTTDPQQQIADAQFLRDELAGTKAVNPISLDYSNPEVYRAYEDQQLAKLQMQDIASVGGVPPADVIARALKNPDPGFAQAKQEYLKGIDRMIVKAKADAAAGRPFRLFPPVRSNDVETVPGMSVLSNALGATEPGPNLGHLAQHQISNVVEPMEQQAKQDRAAMERFLRECGG